MVGTSRMSDRVPTDDDLRAETGRDHLDWFTVLDVWLEDTRDVRQISEFLTTERGLPPAWAQVVASQYVSRRI